MSYRGSKIAVRILSNPLRGLKQNPIELKPGESYSIKENIAVKDFFAMLEVKYSADNDFSHHTNMGGDAYLKSIGKYYDLAKCWQGHINNYMSLFVRSKTSDPKVNTEKKFAEWLKERIAEHP